jgi:nicotinate phosphoribosyltransferase
METKAIERNASASAFLTDLYELTMAAAYFENGITAPASFELWVRTLPVNRGYLLAAGLEQALSFLEDLAFSSEQIEFLRRHPSFAHVGDAFFEFLRTFRFHGEVWAVPEGTPVFALEPLLRVTAPIIEAQIVETFLLTTLTFQTLIATKAARLVGSAAGRDVIEFGSRRAHGPRGRSIGSSCRIHRRMCRDIKRGSRLSLWRALLRHRRPLVCDGALRRTAEFSRRESYLPWRRRAAVGHV